MFVSETIAGSPTAPSILYALAVIAPSTYKSLVTLIEDVVSKSTPVLKLEVNIPIPLPPDIPDVPVEPGTPTPPAVPLVPEVPAVPFVPPPPPPPDIVTVIAPPPSSVTVAPLNVILSTPITWVGTPSAIVNASVILVPEVPLEPAPPGEPAAPSVPEVPDVPPVPESP